MAVIVDGGNRETCQEHLDELALLADTAGYAVVGREVQERDRPDAATLLGRGKVAEIARRVEETGASGLFTDDDLTPRQAARLEQVVGVPVSDRSGLILEIFASRARTREAKTQVELASLRYTLPRLTRKWTHLSRQVGGIGVRGGVGEAQIEIDRRLIRRRIARLQRDLVRITRHRGLRHQARRETFTVALVGYTNSGKSTLFNALTGACVPVENRLFATLDAVRRRMKGSGDGLVLTDTVGFIRKLPHHLVASFRSTLSEVGEADLLMQVVDAADDHHVEKMATTARVLHDLDVGDRRRLLVFNKMDRMVGPAVRTRLGRQFPEALFVSAARGDGLPALARRIAAEQGRTLVEEDIDIPCRDREAMGLLHRHGRVLQVTSEGNRLRVRVRTSPIGAGRIRQGLATPGLVSDV
ncbi:MAG: GTPase HflX [Acidobacteriota bacterium]